MKLSRILLILGLVGLGLIIITNLGQIDSLINAIKHLSWYAIPLLVIAQLASYAANAKYYQSFFSISGEKLSFKRLMKASLAINFTNIAIPSGGVSGTAYLAQTLRGDVSAGRATLGQLSRYAFTFLSFIPVLAFGFFLIYWSGGIAKISVRLTVLIVLIMLVVAIILLILFSQRKILERILKLIVDFINYIYQKILRRKQRLITDMQRTKFIDDLYIGYHEIIDNSKNWPKLFWWALAGNVAEILTLYVVFVGFHVWPNPGGVIIAYTMANSASLLGLISGGVGIYEAVMIATLTALGTPFALSFAIVIIYRGLSMLIFLPIGFYYYRQSLKS